MNGFSIQKDSWLLTVKNKRIAVVLWLITLLCGFPVMRLVQRYWTDAFDGTMVGSVWLKEFDFTYLSELIIAKSPFLSLIIAVFIAMLIIYALLAFWATAGTIGVLADQVRNEISGPDGFLSRFSHAGGKYFSRIFRVSLITALLSIIAMIPFFLGTAGIILGAGIIIIWMMTSDVTKIRLVQEDSRKVFKTYFKVLPWVVKRFHKLILHYGITAAIILIGFLIYSLIDNYITADTQFKIFCVFCMQQLFVFFRSLARIQLFAAVMGVMKPEAESAIEMPVAPAEECQTVPVS